MTFELLTPQAVARSIVTSSITSTADRRLTALIPIGGYHLRCGIQKHLVCHIDGAPAGHDRLGRHPWVGMAVGSGCEGDERDFHLGVCEAAVLAVVGLGEAWRVVPVDGFAGVGEGDEVADAVAEPLADR